MKRVATLLLANLLATIAWTSSARSDSPAPHQVSIGTRVGDLSFKDIRYLPRTLRDFGDTKATVVLATTTTCPSARRAIDQLIELDKAYARQGVQFLALNVGPNDSIREMAAQAVLADAEYPFVKDVEGRSTTALGLSRTGQVALLGPDRSLCYRGAPEALKEALSSLLEGKEVTVVETTALGTPIESAPTASPLAGMPVTYAEHIAPIMKKHCQECHRPGTEAPFSLVSHADLAANAEMVAEVVADERMPPWYASDVHGTFVNKRGLDSSERALVAEWVRAGKLAGNLARVPAPLPPVENQWRIGKPDLVVQTRETYTLPRDGYVPYKYTVLPVKFEQDTWISHAEILPDNPRVVHHCNMAYTKLGAGWGEAKFVLGRVPGVQAMELEKGLAFMIPKGAILILQIHFTTTGKDETCRLSVGFKYPRYQIQKQFHMLWMVDTAFAIPPGARAHRAVGTNTIPCNAIGYGFFAHMHLRGRDMAFNATFPDGRREALLLIPNFSFDWQMGYRFDDHGRRFPKGTELEAVAHYDNSPFNAYNPDPTATVREGQQTFQEMLNGVFFYIDEDESLQLDVDPKTGHVIAPARAAPREKPVAAR